MGRTKRQSRRLLCRFLFLVALWVAGCGGPPQIPKESRRLIESLRTAVSAERTDWLDANEKLIEKQFSQGKLTEEQHAAFAAIIAKARAGKWSDAEIETVRLGKAQMAN